MRRGSQMLSNPLWIVPSGCLTPLTPTIALSTKLHESVTCVDVFVSEERVGKTGILGSQGLGTLF